MKKSKSDAFLRETKSGWEVLKRKEKTLQAFCDNYLDFISKAKTEREAVQYVKGSLKGKHNLHVVENRGKAIAICRKGSRPLSDGVRIIISHLDSPRLDLKANPLYEDCELAMLKTHYYGGIKKYQWLARPLALHGVIIKGDGKSLEIVIGEDPSDPCFTIEDLLPHLARNVQTGKIVADAFKGEKLNIICGSRPALDEKDKQIKRRIMTLLNEKYGLIEEDFISADLEVVPAGPGRSVGLDSSMIGAYGQDDRVCSWAALQAVLDSKRHEHTIIAMLVDKEEIGSDGNTGAKSMFIEEVIWELAEKFGEEVVPSRVLYRSKAISGDVNGALDPEYPEVHEKANAARFGHGICVTKFTGSGGKYSANEAHAEYMGWIRQMLNRRRIPWQTGELGKVDEGGGGTVAKYLAAYGMDIVDMGPALLSMHSPFELASKADIYATYLAYLAFLEER